MSFFKLLGAAGAHMGRCLSWRPHPLLGTYSKDVMNVRSVEQGVPKRSVANE